MQNPDLVSIEEWYSFISEDFVGIEREVQQIPAIEFSEYLDYPIEGNEVYAFLKKCKKGKSAGENQISYEFLKNLPPN